MKLRCLLHLHKWKRITKGTQPFIDYECEYCNAEKSERDYSVAMSY